MLSELLLIGVDGVLDDVAVDAQSAVCESINIMDSRYGMVWVAKVLKN